MLARNSGEKAGSCVALIDLRVSTRLANGDASFKLAGPSKAIATAAAAATTMLMIMGGGDGLFFKAKHKTSAIRDRVGSLTRRAGWRLARFWVVCLLSFSWTRSIASHRVLTLASRRQHVPVCVGPPS